MLRSSAAETFATRAAYSGWAFLLGSGNAGHAAASATGLSIVTEADESLPVTSLYPTLHPDR